MTYLLDTNVCVVYMRGKNALVRSRVLSHPPADLCVCSVVVAELRHGAERSADPAAEHAKVDQFLAPYRSLPFDDDAARVFGQLRADLEAKGTIIADLDIAIAAIAVVHALKVVTHNAKDFARVPGLTVEDWEVP